jgi:hypothetical protein
MSSNEQIILDKTLEQQRTERAPHLSVDKYFQLFTAEQLLKHFDLSYDEIESGNVDGGGDGGIDGFFIFVNGELVREDTDLGGLKKDVVIETIVFQAKTAPSFGEKALDSVTASLRDLFDLSQPLTKFTAVYNKELLAAVELFRNVVTTLAPRFPKHVFSLSYASRGSEIHPNVKRKADLLEVLVKSQFQGATCNMRFLTASDLLAMARETPRRTYQLEVTDAPINTKGGIVGLVRLREYVTFIRDEKDDLRRNLFEANVRDYQGATQVNAEIQKTLSERWPEDFWWLNNGITIVAGKVTQTGKTLTIEDPQIVNGLQTSREIFHYFKTANTAGDAREILVRVISPETPDSRDRVIKATNSQTAISPASLRATDKIQRDIEQYLRAFGLFYDRRKNSHKNEGKPLDKIVSIPAMAQALMAVVLQRPGTARARPSSLLKRDEDYEKVFSESFPIEVFRASIELSRLVEAHLRADTSLSPEGRVNLKFYVAMYLAALLCGVSRPKPDQVRALAGATINTSLLDEATTSVKEIYQDLGATALAAKGSEFGDRLTARLRAAFEEEIEQEDPAQVDGEQGERDSGKQVRTAPELLDAKRLQVINGFAALKGIELVRRSKTLFSSPDKGIRVCCVVSKRYESDYQPYWYRYDRKWDEFLSEGQDAYYVISCMDRDEAFAVPYSWMQENKNNLSVTDSGERLYWHVPVTFDGGKLAINISKTGAKTPLDTYTFESTKIAKG